jgi:probable DNA metabolism protein
MRIYKTLGSIVEDREMKCLRYLELGFKMGTKIQLLHGNSIVHDIDEANFKVGTEVHRLYGLIRFNVVRPANTLKAPEELHEILYSAIEPDNDLIEFLVHHFKDRYHNNPFIIHDKKRDKAVVYGSGKWYITDFDNDNLLKNTKEENEYQRLWKLYFNTIGIKERVNPRCQKNFMPVRYWKHLTEIDATNSL